MSLLDRAGSQAGNDATLTEDRQRDERQRGNHRSGRNFTPRIFVLTGKQTDGDRNRAFVRRGNEGQRIQEFVPRKNEDENRGGGQAGRRQRQEHAAKRTERAAAVDARRAIQLVGNFAQERSEQPQRQRQREGRVGRHQADELVAQADRAQRDVKRAQGGNRREHRYRE